ncbi:MAG: T9SS type B sorting domain-containing protein [Bacteroidetes bacterium]|nr:T9SS type B sorting domain-containing protein [Bacteroidota bacterium]
MCDTGNVSEKYLSSVYMRLFILSALTFLLHLRLNAQSSVIRSFKETGGTVSTGNGGSVNSFSNGDVLVVNERWTNFYQKGIQLFRLAEQGLSVVNSRAYYNDFTVTNIRTAVRNDSVFMLAQHYNGGIYKFLFLVFDKDLGLVRSKLIDGSNPNLSLFGYSFFASQDGSFRIYGNTTLATSNQRCVVSLDANGNLLWKYTIGAEAPLWGGSVLMPDGTLIGMNSGACTYVDKDGNVTNKFSFGSALSYTLNGVVDKDGNGMFCRTGYDSAAYYAVHVTSGGSYTGSISSLNIQAPVLIEAFRDGSYVIGSSSLAGSEVNLKLSLFDENNQFSKNLFISNIYGYAPTGALRDACLYSSHIDAKGNLLVLGVANRKGFFVFRYNPTLGFDCGNQMSDIQSSQAVQITGNNDTRNSLDIKVSDYIFQEETPGNYKPVCQSCGSALEKNLIDTILCLDTNFFTLNAGNPGAQYIWDDGSTNATRTITQSGTYWVRMSNDCDTLIDSAVIEMKKRPKLKASYTPTEPNPGDAIQFRMDPDTISFVRWYIADTLFTTQNQFSWTPVKNGTYFFALEAFNEPGCSAYDTVSVSVNLLDYYFPTAFTPDRNRRNDTWGPVGFGIQEFRLKIFNRWGQEIVHLQNENWDGTVGGVEAEDGLYLYMIWLTDDLGAARFYKGYIYLLR